MTSTTRAVVRLGGGVQPVDRFGRDGDRGVEAEGVVGGAQVVVDRLGHAHDADAVVGQALRDAEGVLAADRDQRVDALVGQDLLDLLDAALDLVRVGARGPQDGAAAGEDVLDVVEAERAAVPGQRAVPAVAEAHEVPAVHLDALAHHGADHRVESRAVAAAGQHTDTHEKPPSVLWR